MRDEMIAKVFKFRSIATLSKVIYFSKADDNKIIKTI